MSTIEMDRTTRFVPCSTCGEQPIYQHEGSGWLVGCCHVKIDGCDSLDDAIEMWNRRMRE